MNYKLTQEQELLRQTIADFSRAEITPLARRIDEEAKVPHDLLGKLPDLGLYGITIPQEYGGAGAEFFSLVIAVEELSKSSGSLGAQLSFHNAVISEALLGSSNSELKSRLLPKLARGSLSAFLIDQKSKISIRAVDGGFLIDGFADHLMSAAVAEIFLIVGKFADGATAILCFSRDELNHDPSFAVGEEERLLGMRGSATAGILFKKLKLPMRSLLFDRKAASHAFEQLLIRSRIAVAVQALGITQASLDASVKYSNERSQFNQKIGSFYAVRDMIAMDEMSVQAARSLTYSVATDLASATSKRDSGIAKVLASNASVQAAKHSIRIHGGYGYVRDYPVERYLRDARLTQIYIESNEKLKSEIAGSLLGSSSLP